MSLEHLLRDEEEALSFLLGEEFEMEQYQCGEPIWWHDQPRSGYGAQRPVTAVFVAMRGSRAGIAVKLRNGSWLPKVVKVASISSRFEEGV